MPILGYLIQIRPRIINRYFGVDAWRNLSISDYIRENKRLPQYLPKYMLKGPFDYPPLLNIILSVLPKKFLEDNQGFISPVFDAANNYLIFIVTYLLTGNLFISIFSQLVYIATPMAAVENASLTARSLGSLLFTLAFSSMIVFGLGHWLPVLMLALFFTTLLFFSQKMAIQALFFLSLLFSIAERDFIYLLIFIFSLIAAAFFSRGFSLRILAGQISVLRYFRKIIKSRYAHQLRGVVNVPKNADFIERIKALIRRQPLFALTASCPFITISFLISLWVLLFPDNTLLINYPQLSVIFRKFSLWVSLLYCLGIVTAQLRPFQFLGEGMKYLMYAGLPASFIISTAVFEFAVKRGSVAFLACAVLVMLISLLQIFFIQNKAIVNDSARTITPALRKIMDFLQIQPQEVRLATIPFSLSDAVAYFTKSNVLSSDSAYVLGNNADYLDFYPVLRKPLEQILNRHNINYLLIDKNYVNIEELKLSAIDIAIEQDHLCLIKI